MLHVGLYPATVGRSLDGLEKNEKVVFPINLS